MPFLIWPILTLLSGAVVVKVISNEVEDTVTNTVPVATNNIATGALVVFAIWMLWKQMKRGKS